MKSRLPILLCLLLLSPTVHAEQPGTIVRQAKVYAEPGITAAPVGVLRAGTGVSLFERRGGWQEVYSESDQTVGWVRVFEVRAGQLQTTVIVEEKEDSRGFLAGLASLSRRASGFFRQDTSATSSSTATIGVRGLSESEIESAQADFDELEKMKTFASNKKRAKRFAKAGGLRAKKVAYLPEPEQ